MKLFLMTVISLFILVSCDSRTAEQIGADMAQKRVDIIKGAGEVVKNEGEGVANTVAQGVGNIVSGLQNGFDESLVKTDVRLSDKIKPKYLIVSRAQRIDSTAQDAREGLSLFLTSTEGFSGNLRLVAYSKDGQVGQSKLDVTLEKEDAKFVDFEFDQRTPFSIVQHYTLETVN